MIKVGDYVRHTQRKPLIYRVVKIYKVARTPYYAVILRASSSNYSFREMCLVRNLRRCSDSEIMAWKLAGDVNEK